MAAKRTSKKAVKKEETPEAPSIESLLVTQIEVSKEIAAQLKLLNAAVDELSVQKGDPRTDGKFLRFFRTTDR